MTTDEDFDLALERLFDQLAESIPLGGTAASVVDRSGPVTLTDVDVRRSGASRAWFGIAAAVILAAGFALSLAGNAGGPPDKAPVGSEAMRPEQRLGLPPEGEISLRSAVTSIEEEDVTWTREYTVGDSRRFLIGQRSASSLAEERRRFEQDLEDWPDPDDFVCLGGAGISYVCGPAGEPGVELDRSLTPDIIVWWELPDNAALVALTSPGTTVWQAPVVGVAAFERPLGCRPCDYELKAYDEAGTLIDEERGTWLRAFS
jgi:hypothetical protein